MTPDEKYAEDVRKYNLGDAEQAIIRESMREFTELQAMRNVFAAQWEEIAALVEPRFRNTFFYGSYNWPGMKRTEMQVDASGMMACNRFAAICDSLLTPRNMIWQQLTPSDPYLQKDRQTKLFFEDLTRSLFHQRNSPVGNFPGQNFALLKQLGQFGTSGMLVEEYADPQRHIRALRYINVPLGQLFLHQNYQGAVDGFCRWYKMTARQAAQRFGEKRLPEVLRSALDQNSEWLYNFLHRVCPRADTDQHAIGAKNKPFASYHISLEGTCLLAEPGGYRMVPIIASRYTQAPDEVYGTSPAMEVLPALKTLNAEKRTFLKAGHRAADPVLLTSDDGLMDVSMIPGALNKGGMTADGKPLVGTLPIGNIQITKEMMDEERGLINDAFLVSLFQILTETPQMSATEVIERTNEKGILLAPTVGRQEAEYLGPLTHRELDCMGALGLIPPLPPALHEAGGGFSAEYSSPMARAARAQNAAGFMRTLQSVQELVQITGDQSLLHPFNFKKAIPEIAALQAVPESWMASQDEIAQKDQALAQAQAKQQQIQAAPAAAAMMKAQAVTQKNNPQPPQQGLPPVPMVSQPGMPPQMPPGAGGQPPPGPVGP